MIHTIFPYGAIAESEVVKVQAIRDKFYLTDIYANKIEIDQKTFNELKNKGY